MVAYESSFATSRTTDKDIKSAEDYFSECEDNFLIERGKYLDAIDILNKPASTNVDQAIPPATEGNRHAPKRSKNDLPRISLPNFSGKYADWPSYKDYFTSLIRSNEDLRPVEKMHYLKSSLSGDAANLIKHIPVTAENYTRAWEKLEDHYSSTRKLIRQCLNTLFQLKPMTSESHAALTQLRDGTNDAIETLTALQRPVDKMDDLLVHMTVQKLDPTTKRDWDISLGKNKTPTTWTELDDFLQARISALEDDPPSKEARQVANSKKMQPTSKVTKNQSLTVHTTSKPKPVTCVLCKKEHLIHQCETFNSYGIDAKHAFVLEKNLCMNCLKPHPVSLCRSRFNCRSCNGRHHTLLHQDCNDASLQQASTSTAAQTTPATAGPTKSPANVNAHTTNASHIQHGSILLATARVCVFTSNQRTEAVRALIDPCSEASFIAESLAQRLRVSRQATFVPILGVGATPSYTAKSAAAIEIAPSRDSQQRLTVRALILPKLTEYLPPLQRFESSLAFANDLCLADPQPQSRDRIEMILGADTFIQVIQEGLRRSPHGDLIAQSTKLGWILTGAASMNQGSPAPTVSSLQCVCDTELSQLLEKFWLQEEPSKAPPKPLTADELECEEHFERTHRRDEHGRFIVRMPFKANKTQLGDSRPAAVNALLRAEQRFKKFPQLKEKYAEFMDEYRQLGHMRPAPSDPPLCQVFFLPHHGVFKTHGDTSKLRVVFNGSVKLPAGLPINDCLHAGPKLQLDIFDVLVTWRKRYFAFTTDIKKMFRQVRVADEDQPAIQIAWRKSESGPVQYFYLTTVTYGLTCSGYQAIRCLRQLASDEEQNAPRASAIIRKKTYVDDVYAGADSFQELLDIKTELIRMLESGGFPLSKWASNSTAFIQEVPSQDRAPMEEKKLPQTEDSGSFRTLGVSWHPRADVFSFKFDKPAGIELPTKRSVLALTAQLYDPIGWIVPFTISFKIFLQVLWHTGLQWDDPLPIRLRERWDELARQLPELEYILVPRWIGYSNDVLLVEFHGFSDASEKAYAACVYLRTVNTHGEAISKLISAKSKVAPLKQVSLPRLELCGAVMLTRLTKRLQEALKLTNATCHLWSDFTITLAWIREYPASWKTYVANRVSEIQTTLPLATWHHVPGKCNPADLASRGISASDLAGNSLWFNGPSFLTDTEEAWTAIADESEPVECPEKRAAACLLVSTQASKTTIESDLLRRYSSLKRLLSTTAWCLKYIEEIKIKKPRSLKSKEPVPVLTPTQISNALMHWVRYVQRLHYEKELTALQNQKQISTKSTLIKMNPIIDENNTLRVGGRLKHSLLHPDEAHPAILPCASHLTRLLVTDAHQQTLHGGVQLTLNLLRQRFWIVRGRQVVKSFISQCHRCWRHKSKPAIQIMADLPLERVQRSRPFTHTGVDFAGPISMRLSNGRGTKSYKGYISVFVCLSTRAIHLEAVSGYTTGDFLFAFRRFIARRGRCALLVSDCGTNFVGANRELRTLFQQATAQCEEIAKRLAEDGTEWRFNPPSAPHFGGIWEAAVKSVKFHLKRVIGDNLLTFEEMSTLLAQVEACLNSRPITALTDDPSDLSALTPGHFLIGMSPTAVPEPSLQGIPIPRMRRWQLIQRMHEHFWTRWSQEYLHSLQQRAKWTTNMPPVKVGDLCLLRSDNLPPCKWALAKIIEIHPGADGLPRVATIKTATTTLVRPIVKLSLLPQDTENH